MIALVQPVVPSIGLRSRLVLARSCEVAVVVAAVGTVAAAVADSSSASAAEPVFQPRSVFRELDPLAGGTPFLRGHQTSWLQYDYNDARIESMEDQPQSASLYLLHVVRIDRCPAGTI